MIGTRRYLLARDDFRRKSEKNSGARKEIRSMDKPENWLIRPLSETKKGGRVLCDIQHELGKFCFIQVSLG
jgi:hypothetical protein